MANERLMSWRFPDATIERDGGCINPIARGDFPEFLHDRKQMVLYQYRIGEYIHAVRLPLLYDFICITVFESFCRKLGTIPLMQVGPEQASPIILICELR